LQKPNQCWCGSEVEQRTRNAQAVGSIPTTSSIEYKILRIVVVLRIFMIITSPTGSIFDLIIIQPWQ
jgi:hypothetical protein